MQTRYWNDDIDLYSHILDVNPRSYVANNNLASVLLRQNRYPEAYARIKKSVELNPDYFMARLNYSRILQKRGDIDGSLREYAAYLRIRESMPSRGGATYAEDLNQFGEALINMQRYPLAIEQFEHALRVDPSYTAAKENLAIAKEKLRTATQPAKSPNIP
jgi:tetratricopeptide (TPR) repeat protein